MTGTLAEIGWADDVVATIGPYELVQQPTRAGIWYLIDTRSLAGGSPAWIRCPTP